MEWPCAPRNVLAQGPHSAAEVDMELAVRPAAASAAEGLHAERVQLPKQMVPLPLRNGLTAGCKGADCARPQALRSSKWPVPRRD